MIPMKKRLLNLRNTILLLPLLFLAGKSQAGTWTYKAPVPAPRSGPAAGVINGILYLAGGHNGVSDSPTVQAYNPATDSWSTLASMPGGRYQGDGAGVISNKLYVAGGWTTSPGLPNNNLWVYDPGANTWATRAGMPILSACGSSGVINNKLYITTACDGNSGYRSFLHVYDPALNSWSALANTTHAHSNPGYGVINGKFYVAGGVNESSVVGNTLEVYDPGSNIWTSKASMLTARAGAASSVINGKLYVTGGDNGAGTFFATTEVYDPATDSWSTETPAQQARSLPAGGAINGVFFVSAGGNGSGNLSSTEAFMPSAGPLFESAIYLGAAADQRGTGIKCAGGAVYISGYNSVYGGLLARLPVPLGAPVWNFLWTSNSQDNFSGIAVSASGVYAAGPNYTRTTDSVGGKESKGLMVKFPLTGATGPGFQGATWERQTPAAPGAFSYGGGEGLNGTILASESGSNFVYTTGSGQSSGANGGRLYISKLAEDSTVMWTRTDGAEQVGVSYSVGEALASLNTNVYVAGLIVGSVPSGQAYLRKYDASGNLLWSRSNSVASLYRGITSLGNALFAAGNAGTGSSSDFLIEKWDEAGNKIWSRTYDRNASEDALTGIVAVGGRLFAAGYTRGATAGGADSALLEINPVNGDLLSDTLYGGGQDDMADGIDTDGTDLYLVGETKSYGNGSNQVMVVRYSLPAQLTNIIVTPANPFIGVGTNLQFTATGNFLDGTSRALVAGGNTWSNGTSIPTPSYGLGAAFVGGKFYAISGFATTRVGVYDPTLNSWSTVAPLPQLLQYFGTAVLDGKIYVVGGDTGGGGARATLYRFDPTANTWTTLAPMPLGARYGLMAVALNGKIYAIGGYDTAYLTRVEVYDPASNTWTTGTPLPSPRASGMAGAINGKIYVAAGADGVSTLTNTIAFDPNLNTWTTLAPMLRPQNGGYAVLNGKLYTTGATATAPDSPQSYDPVSNIWSTNYATMPTDRHDLGVAADEATRRLFAVGGYNGGTTAALEIFTAPGELTWASGTPSVASINASGLAGGLTNGTSAITASSRGVSGSTLLTVVVAPTITAQPVNTTASPGGTTTLSVTGAGGGLAYQWRLNGTNIVGATNSSLTLSNITASQAGVYTVLVSNAAGTITSSAATLSLLGIKQYAGLTITGQAGGNYLIEYMNTINSSWATLTNITIPVSPYLFIDTDSPNHPSRFYRASLVP